MAVHYHIIYFVVYVDDINESIVSQSIDCVFRYVIIIVYADDILVLLTNAR